VCLLLIDGYGHEVFEKYLKINENLKGDTMQSSGQILGRDFAGTIMATGLGVEKFKPGQQVMGYIPPPLSGSHAQFVTVNVSPLKDNSFYS
jgi:NADPH:quinone reductase-like Zn-dependent oxidoreductase